MKRNSRLTGRAGGISFPGHGLGARRRSGGFKLVEFVAVLAIACTVGVSAVSASYDSSGEGPRASAQLAMAEIASLEEQHFLNKRRYTRDLTEMGLAAEDATTPGGHYALRVDFPAPDACPTGFCYIVRAVPQGGQAEDGCGTLSLTSDGEKLPAGCW